MHLTHQGLPLASKKLDGGTPNYQGVAHGQTLSLAHVRVLKGE